MVSHCSIVHYYPHADCYAAANSLILIPTQYQSPFQAGQNGIGNTGPCKIVILNFPAGEHLYRGKWPLGTTERLVQTTLAKTEISKRAIKIPTVCLLR